MVRIWLTLLLLFTTAPAWATTKYVDASPGADCASTYNEITRTCTGGSFASWNTIEEGIANLGASNTLIIRAGSYSGGGQASPPSGTVAAPTIIKNEPGESYTWTKTSGSNNTLVYSSGKVYWQFICDVPGRCDLNGANYDHDLLDPNSVELAIIAGYNADFVTIRNLTLHDSRASGIYANDTSDGWTVAGNLIHHLGDGPTQGHRGHGIYVSGDNWLIEHNTIHTAYGSGIQCYSGDTGNPHCDGSIIRYNRIYNGGLSAANSLAEITVDGTGNQIYRNTIRCGHSAGVDNAFQRGIDVYYYDPASDNNLIYQNSITRCGVAVSIENGTTSTGNLVKNNIFYLNTTGLYGGNAGGTSSNNLTSNPSWVDADNNDFTLQAGSAAIGYGVAIPGFASNGSAPDAGALETFGFSSATLNAASMDVSLAMSLNTPILPASGQTGWTVACSGSNCGTPVVLNATRLTGADSVVRLALTGIGGGSGVCAVGQTWTVSYNAGTGNVTDSALLGGVTTANQPMTAFTTQAVTNACGVASPDPPAGPHISYNLDQNTGTQATDSTANLLHGTLTNTPTWEAPGKHGASAVHFLDGSTQHIAIPYGSGINPTTQSFTACMGVKPDAAVLSSQRVFFGSSNGTGQRFYLGLIANTFSLGFQGSGMASNPEFPALAEYTRICLRNDAATDTATLFKNGVKGTSAQSVKTATSFTLASNLRLGYEPTFTINYGGTTIDDYVDYTSVLTDQQIADDYAAWEPSPPPVTGTFSQVAHQFDEALYVGGSVVHLGAVNAAISLRAGTPFALTVQTDCTVANCDPIGQRLYVSRDGGPFGPVQDVMGPNGVAFYGATSNPLVLSGAVTAALSGSLTYTAGTTNYDMSAVPVYDLPVNGSIAERYMLQTDPAITLNSTFDFKVRVQTGELFTTYTPSGGARITITPSGVIGAPAGLRLAGATAPNTGALIWGPNTDANFAGFHIYQSTTSGVYTGEPVKTITPDSARAAHSPITQWLFSCVPGTTQYWIVKAFDTGEQESAASGEITKVCTAPPARTARVP
jgi:hypothetical protein